MKSRRTCTQQNDSTSSVSLANRLYENSCRRSPAAGHGAKCCFGTRPNGSERPGVNTMFGTPEAPTDTSAGGVLAVGLERPARTSACQCWTTAARDQRLLDRREQRRQTTHTVGDGALGDPAHARADPGSRYVGRYSRYLSISTVPIPRCPGCPSGSAVYGAAAVAAPAPPRTSDAPVAAAA